LLKVKLDGTISTMSVELFREALERAESKGQPIILFALIYECCWWFFSVDSSPHSPHTSRAGRSGGCPDILTPPSKNEETIQPEQYQQHPHI
jgi:hypothetical protein